MKVLEIKNNLVKIEYEASDNLALSGFVIIEDSNNPYVAQVVNLKGDLNSNFAIVKLLFTFDEDGILKNYNGTIPSTNARVSSLPSNELLDIIPIETSVFIGNLAQQNVALKVDKSIFENNLLICSDNFYNTTSLLDKFIKQVGEKTVIIDSEGLVDSDNKVKLGVDFRLPLNYDTIDFIYENDLEDVEAINKAIIQDVFIEVQNYVKNLPEKFLPFDSFVNVIDAQYRETQIPELILLKNKLLKYKEMNLFAQDLKDIMNLAIAVEKNESVVIDISDIPDNVKKEVFRYVYDVLNDVNSKIYSFVKVNNSNVTKRLLKRFIERNNVFTTIICPHEFKYIEDIKGVSQNIIFFAPQTLTHDFASYNTYLSKLNNDEFVIYGAHTQNIPFITEITDIEDMAVSQPSTYQQKSEIDSNENESVSEDDMISFNDIVVQDNEELSEEISDNSEEEYEENNDEFVEDDSEEIVDDVAEDSLDENFESNDINENIEIVEDNSEESAEDDFNHVDEDVPIEEEYIEPTSSEQDMYSESVYDNQDSSFEESISEEPQEEFYEEPVVQAEDNMEEQSEDIYVEPIVEPLVTEEEHDQIVEQVSKDVDRMFYEKIEDNEPDDFADTSEDLTEDDLNLIEDLATDDVPLAGEIDDAMPLEEEEQPPVVPIYPADDIEANDTPEFQPGEHVTTAKYGDGVVEKMIKYGNKMLCSIDFPSIGRRLLDPAMTEITRIN